MNEDLKALSEKIIATISRDVNNMYVRATGLGKSEITPEDQEALVKYYKLLTDVRIAAKERELEEKISLAEEAIARGSAPKS